MSEFKYLKVVETKTPIKKPDYYIIEAGFNDTQFDLLLPLAGKSAEEVGQIYLYSHKNKQAVYVRRYLPETKYETFVDELHNKNARKQLDLFQKEEAEKTSKQKLEVMLKEF